MVKLVCRHLLPHLNNKEAPLGSRLQSQAQLSFAFDFRYWQKPSHQARTEQKSNCTPAALPVQAHARCHYLGLDQSSTSKLSSARGGNAVQPNLATDSTAHPHLAAQPQLASNSGCMSISPKGQDTPPNTSSQSELANIGENEGSLIKAGDHGPALTDKVHCDLQRDGGSRDGYQAAAQPSLQSGCVETMTTANAGSEAESNQSSSDAISQTCSQDPHQELQSLKGMLARSISPPRFSPLPFWLEFNALEFTVQINRVSECIHCNVCPQIDSQKD